MVVIAWSAWMSSALLLAIHIFTDVMYPAHLTQPSPAPGMCPHVCVDV